VSGTNQPFSKSLKKPEQGAVGTAEAAEATQKPAAETDPARTKTAAAEGAAAHHTLPSVTGEATRLQHDASDPDASAWVSASAGSGKTKVLIDRMLRLLLPREDGRPGTAPEKILALTYTKAAANEMALRLSDKLAAWAVMSADCGDAADEISRAAGRFADETAQGTGQTATQQRREASDNPAAPHDIQTETAPVKQTGLRKTLADLLGREPSRTDLEEARALFARVVDVPGGLKIMTIHSFCQSVLGRFPVEAGIAPHFTPLEEEDSQNLLAEAKKRVLTRALQQPGSPLAQAVYTLGSLMNEGDFDDLTRKIIAERRQMAEILTKTHGIDGLYTHLCMFFGVQPGLSTENAALSFCTLEEEREKSLRRIVSTLSPGKGVRDQKKLEILQDFLDAPPAERTALYPAYKKIFFDSKGNIQEKPFTAAMLEKMPEAAGLMAEEALRIVSHDDMVKAITCAASTRDLFLLGSAITEDYQAAKQKRGALDFDDLVIYTLSLLKGDAFKGNIQDSAAWVLYKLDEGIDHILLDEAQDTNPEQWEIIRLLCEEFFNGLAARDDITRTLFVVGDKKQSIYSFQRAAPEEFERMRHYFSGKIRDSDQIFKSIDINTSFRSVQAILDSVDMVFAAPDTVRGLGDHYLNHIAARQAQGGLIELWPLCKQVQAAEEGQTERGDGIKNKAAIEETGSPATATAAAAAKANSTATAAETGADDVAATAATNALAEEGAAQGAAAMRATAAGTTENSVDNARAMAAATDALTKERAAKGAAAMRTAAAERAAKKMVTGAEAPVEATMTASGTAPGTAPETAPRKQDGWVIPDKIQESQSGAAQMAAKIGDTIQSWLRSGEKLASYDRPIRPGDIMILVRSRSAFVGQLVSALKRRAIPVSGVDRMVLANQMVVQDLCTAGRFALLPDDDLTLAGLLKSPFIGMDEETLYALCQGRGGTVWESVKKNGDGVIITWLEQLIAHAGNLPPYEFFSHILQQPCPAGDYNGMQAIRARLGEDALDPLEEFLNIALSYETSHTAGLEAFLKAQEDDSRQIKRELEEASNAVRIMTVHGAKGLQAPIVFLPDTVRTHSSVKPDKILWPHKTGEKLPLYLPSKESLPAAAKKARQRIEDALDDEYRRLLYVAMTRAEERLYIGGYLGKRTPGDSIAYWYGDISRAIRQMEGAVRLPAGIYDENGAEQEMIRVASEQTAAPDKAAGKIRQAHVQTVAVPEWAGRGAPAEPAPPRPLAPSRPSGDEPAAASPLSVQAGDRFRRGNITHKLLQLLPDLPESERLPAMTRYLENYTPALDPALRQDIADETMAVLSHAGFAALFGAGSLAEVPVTGLLPDGRLIAGQLDRLLVTDTEILIVDYKTNRPPPLNEADVPAIYRGQLRAYAEMLALIYPGRTVRAALLWTDGARLMPVPVQGE